MEDGPSLSPQRICHEIVLWIRHMIRFLLPCYCVVCGNRLTEHEEILCAKCHLKLPFTKIRGEKGNEIERLFWMRLPIVRASAYFYYNAFQRETKEILFSLKYRKRPEIGRFFGKAMATELIGTDFFEGIDFMIPIPLSTDRQRKRGYNQSTELALGISQVTGIPVREDIVSKAFSHPSQTHLHIEQRRKNVKDVFLLTKPDAVVGKHILIIDDVLTTGSTIQSIGEEIQKAGDVRISILVMGLAHHYKPPRDLIKIQETFGEGGCRNPQTN